MTNTSKWYTNEIFWCPECDKAHWIKGIEIPPLYDRERLCPKCLAKKANKETKDDERMD